MFFVVFKKRNSKSIHDKRSYEDAEHNPRTGSKFQVISVALWPPFNKGQ